MKSEEVKKMSDDQLAETVKQLRTQLFELKVQAVTEKLENPRRFGQIRKDVARVKTEQRARETAANGSGN